MWHGHIERNDGAEIVRTQGLGWWFGNCSYRRVEVEMVMLTWYLPNYTLFDQCRVGLDIIDQVE